ncbi:hypothetical protein LEN26_010537 [Aphanomyces euteiches]|nr:hypothetical protein LEN26_010537 [Aphanomyces euteiches]KAH9185547.1 hypothetical protein AeNC1_012477 [Aphanomyces euteiches]
MRLGSCMVLAATLLSSVHAACPKAPNSGLICNGRGSCTPLGECQCDDSAFGFDCSQVRCPEGTAWSGQAFGVNQIHVPAECSRRGTCDRSDGKCDCDPGFTGIACDKLMCPNACSRNGQCLSMAQLALQRSPNEFTYSTIWDANMIYGCLCDPGSEGVDCSLRTCSLGDDPMTTGQVNEVQLLKCTASGFFFLKFKGVRSQAIPATASATQLQSILQRVRSIGAVKVTYSVGTTLCNSAASNVVSVEFRSSFGPQAPLIAVTLQNEQPTLTDGNVIVATGGAAVGTVVSVRGTKEYIPCSGRGYCIPKTGQCSCYTFPMPGYRSSDGYGNVGIRGDCGAPDNLNFYGGPIKGCPGYVPCSGHGACSGAPSFKCTCAVGWVSGDCSQRDCPKGQSWFSLPVSNNLAHTTWTTCSDGGICDPITGECACEAPFAGAACEIMQCPMGSDQARVCSGHGVCLSLSDLAEATTIGGVPAGYTYGAVANNPSTWDAAKIFGCKCDAQYIGHDCSQRKCPTGDDPLTLGQVNEVQQISCQANGGTFQIAFRGATSSPIAFNAPVARVQDAFLAIPTITDISITYSQQGGGACIGGNIMTITFTQDFGALPLLVIVDQALTLSGQSQQGKSIVSRIQAGTKENAVCSNHGTCNYNTGVCHCGFGFGSSNGYGQPGNRGDCGYVMPWQVVVY